MPGALKSHGTFGLNSHRAQNRDPNKGSGEKAERVRNEIKRKYFLLHVVQNVAELNRGLIRVIGSKFSQRAAEGRLKGLRLLCVYVRERASRICAALCVSLGAASFSLCLQLYLALARPLRHCHKWRLLY